jgi:GNAT superfamily N-acetyltransferase
MLQHMHAFGELDHRDASVAAEIARVQHAAYQVEADLIGFDGIPPLHETASDVTRLELTLVGARDETGRLVGLVGYRRSADAVDIDRLAVDPEFHRRGIGAQLLDEVHRREHTATVFEVSTGAANTPAIRLYHRLGYHTTGREHLPQGLTSATTSTTHWATARSSGARCERLPVVSVLGGSQRPVKLPAGSDATPVLDDLPVLHPPHLYVIDCHDAIARRNTEHLADVSEAGSAAMDDEVAFCNEFALQPLDGLEAGEETSLPRPSVCQIAGPRMGPVRLVEALVDDFHVPVAISRALFKEASHDLLGCLPGHGRTLHRGRASPSGLRRCWVGR